MKNPFQLQRVMVALTLINLMILGVSLSRGQAIASPEPSDGVLRGRGLQIVDGQGRVRASIGVMPASKQPDGSIYPETVLLRLITAQGRPVVKISSSEDGAGLALSAAEGPAYAQIMARGNEPHFVIVDGGGKESKLR